MVSSELTSLTTFEEYGWRFNIEEFFLDDKSGAFQADRPGRCRSVQDLEDSHLRDARKLERLLLVLALSLLMLVSQGTQIVGQGTRRTVGPHWRGQARKVPLCPRQARFVLPQNRLALLKLCLESWTRLAHFT